MDDDSEDINSSGEASEIDKESSDKESSEIDEDDADKLYSSDEDDDDHIQGESSDDDSDDSDADDSDADIDPDKIDLDGSDSDSGKKKKRKPSKEQSDTESSSLTTTSSSERAKLSTTTSSSDRGKSNSTKKRVREQSDTEDRGKSSDKGREEDRDRGRQKIKVSTGTKTAVSTGKDRTERSSDRSSGKSSGRDNDRKERGTSPSRSSGGAKITSSSSSRGSRAGKRENSLRELVEALGKLNNYLYKRLVERSKEGDKSSVATYEKQRSIVRSLLKKFQGSKKEEEFEKLWKKPKAGDKYLGLNQPTYLTLLKILNGEDLEESDQRKTLRVPRFASGRTSSGDIEKVFEYMAEQSDMYEKPLKLWRAEMKRGDPLRTLMLGKRIPGIGEAYLENIIAPYVSGLDSFKFNIKDTRRVVTKTVTFADILSSVATDYIQSEITEDLQREVTTNITSSVTNNLFVYKPDPYLLRVCLKNASRYDFDDGKSIGILQLFKKMNIKYISQSDEELVYLFGFHQRSRVQYIQVIFVQDDKSNPAASSFSRFSEALKKSYVSSALENAAYFPPSLPIQKRTSTSRVSESSASRATSTTSQGVGRKRT